MMFFLLYIVFFKKVYHNKHQMEIDKHIFKKY